MTLHLELSIIRGTLAISGSAAMSLTKRSIASSESSKPSSILISIICAPFSTCWRATSRAASKSPLTISFLNTADPVTLVRSPTLTNKLSDWMVQGSRPDRRQAIFVSGPVVSDPVKPVMPRGGIDSRACANDLMCSGVVPQQPPMMFTYPDSAHSLMCAVICAGVSSYSPKAFGRPALG